MKDILKQTTRRVGHFYQSKLNLEFKALGKICPITANATCKIGQTEISLLKFESKNCSGKFAYIYFVFTYFSQIFKGCHD